MHENARAQLVRTREAMRHACARICAMHACGKGVATPDYNIRFGFQCTFPQCYTYSLTECRARDRSKMSFLGLFKTAAVFTRATSTRALTIITKYPKSSMAAASVLPLPFAHYGLISLSRSRLETPILKKMEARTSPNLYYS